MSDALNIAASGLRAEDDYISKIAHDLSNLNTNDYKATAFVFEDLIYQDSNQTQEKAENNMQIGLGSAIYQSGQDFTTGPLKSTNNWNDVAINGSGLYQVLGGDGELFYTRNSSFTLDSEGYLATQNGLRLADNIQIPEDFTELSIKPNGEVEVLRANETEPELIGNIQLASFSNPGALKAMGSGIYAATLKAGSMRVEIPGEAGLGPLVQKHIEGSNVDMLHALMQLTMAQRVYQLNAKVAQVADELEKMTNELNT